MQHPANPAADKLERDAARVMWFSAVTTVVGIALYVLGL